MDTLDTKRMETDRAYLWDLFLLRMKYLNRAWILLSLHNGIVGRVYTLLTCLLSVTITVESESSILFLHLLDLIDEKRCRG